MFLLHFVLDAERYITYSSCPIIFVVSQAIFSSETIQEIAPVTANSVMLLGQGMLWMNEIFHTPAPYFSLFRLGWVAVLRH